MTELTVTPLTGTIGAEISGVDLGKPLDQGTLDAIYQVLIERLVIFFRDQDISPARHQDFAQSFGDLDAPHPALTGSSCRPMMPATRPIPTAGTPT